MKHMMKHMIPVECYLQLESALLHTLCSAMSGHLKVLARNLWYQKWNILNGKTITELSKTQVEKSLH